MVQETNARRTKWTDWLEFSTEGLEACVRSLILFADMCFIDTLGRFFFNVVGERDWDWGGRDRRIPYKYSRLL